VSKVYVKPPKAAKKFARWGLEARDQAAPSKKGGLSTQEAGRQGVGSGVARARDIINDKRVDAKQVKAFFDRHENNYEAAKKRANKSGQTLKEAAPEEKSIQSWWLWGGDPMRKAAEKAVSRRTAQSTKVLKQRLLR
jgi:hypothetical protein